VTTASIALFGAGGKMGARLSRNLQKTSYRVRHIEPSPAGRQRLQEELGVECMETAQALDGADVVILAIPDTVIGKVAHEIAPQLRPGTMVITLDAAAPFAGHLPPRPDLVYFVAHPCHPPIFNDESEEAAATRLLRRAPTRSNRSSAP
jgi:ketol-acid reductoisomerase